MFQLPSRRTNAGDSAATNLLLIFALAAIFTFFALPGYRSYTLREHSKLARIVMVDASDRFRDWQKTHALQAPVSFGDLGFLAAALYVNSDGTAQPSANINSIYRVSLAAADTAPEQRCGLQAAKDQGGFILVAEPIQTQRIETMCARLCLSSSGQKGVTGSAGVAQCWAKH